MNIGIIAEGHTDQLVLENVIIGFFGSDDHIEANFLQPPRDETDKSTHDGGGWSNLRDYCEDDKSLRSAFNSNDYLVIHLDTDILHEFGVDVTGQETVPEKIENAKNVLFSIIDNEILNTHGNQILYAIAVDSIECWIYALMEKVERKKNQKANCLNRMNRILNKSKGITIAKGSKNHFTKIYFEFSEPLSNTKVLEKIRWKNDSLNAFYQSMEDKWNGIAFDTN